MGNRRRITKSLMKAKGIKTKRMELIGYEVQKKVCSKKSVVKRIGARLKELSFKKTGGNKYVPIFRTVSTVAEHTISAVRV